MIDSTLLKRKGFFFFFFLGEVCLYKGLYSMATLQGLGPAPCRPTGQER